MLSARKVLWLTAIGLDGVKSAIDKVMRKLNNVHKGPQGTVKGLQEACNMVHESTIQMNVT